MEKTYSQEIVSFIQLRFLYSQLSSLYTLSIVLLQRSSTYTDLQMLIRVLLRTVFILSEVFTFEWSVFNLERLN